MNKERSFRLSQAKVTDADIRKAQDCLFIVLDNIDAFVYVADMETFEILFVNKHIRDLWGDILGKICWQELQTDQKGPCSFCNNLQLLQPDGKPAGVKRRVFQNTRSKRWYDCRDCAIRWVDGRIVRLEIALDITEWKAAEEELARLKVLHALEDERIRLARDLHDELGMTLTSIKLELQLLNKSLTARETGLEKQLHSSIDLVNASLDRIREKSASLRPPALDDLGLVAAVYNLVQALKQGSNIRVVFNATNEQARFSPDIEIALYRFIQEALSNVIRHASALNVTVDLSWDLKEIKVMIKDDGVGFQVDEQGLFKKTLGLQGMKERVSLLGGTFKINSSRESGTEIMAHIPLEASKRS